MFELYKYFTKRDDSLDEKRVAYMMWYCDNFPAEEFKGEDFYMYHLIDYVSKLKLPLKQRSAEVFASTELKELMKTSKVKLAGTEQYKYDEPIAFETAYTITKEVLINGVRELVSEPCDMEDFKLDIKEFLNNRYSDRYIEVMEESYKMMSKSKSVADCAQYTTTALGMLREIYDPSNLEILDDYVYANQDDDFLNETLVDTGIPALTKAGVCLCRGEMHTIEAPTGGGKTRLTLFAYIYRAAVVFKRNTLFWALEQSKYEIECMLISIHLLMKYGKQIDNKAIEKKTYNPEDEEIVKIAKLDLFESGHYGKITIKDEPLYADTFIDKLETIDALSGPYDVIAIDYMLLLDKPMSREYAYAQAYELNALSYRRFKRYARRRHKGVVAINQFNREGDAVAKADKDIEPSHSAGGMEAHRSSDLSLAITFTKVMEGQNRRRLQVSKSRHIAPGTSVITKVRLGLCYFEQDNTAKL